jgi:hypothetical protein
LKWVTRERPVIDRIACPWLIARFIDAEAEFLFVPPSEVIRVAQETGAMPYDVPGVEFTHFGEGCSFDAFVATYGLQRDPALVTIAAIVRGADTDRHDLTPQSAGLLAISMGLRDVTPDDHEVLRHGFVMYDALYAWAKTRRYETHSWPPVGFSADGVNISGHGSKRAFPASNPPAPTSIVGLPDKTPRPQPEERNE